MTDPGNLTEAAELVASLRTRGLSNVEIGEALHRSPSQVSNILRGKTSGASFVPALQELAQTGQVTNVPRRRRKQDGSPVLIRGKGGAMAPPEDMGGRFKPQPARTRFSSSTAYGEDGFRMHQVTLPKTRTAPGREKGAAEVLGKLRNAARGQRFGDRDVKINVTLKSGQQIELGGKGGYHSTAMLKSIKAFDTATGHKGDVLGWLATQMAENAKSPLPEGFKPVDITGVDVTVYKSDVTREVNRVG